MESLLVSTGVVVLADKIPMKLVHGIAAAIFAALGLATLLGAGAGFGL